jgi:hypothetical protein
MNRLKLYLTDHAPQFLVFALLLLGVACGVVDPVVASAASFALTTTGQLGNGTQVKVSAGSPTGTYSTVGNCRNVDFDTGSSAKIDMTNLSSSWKEFLLGLPDPGSLTFEVDTDFGDAGQAVLRSARVNRTRCDFQVVLPAGTTPTASMQGFVCKFPISTSVDNPVKTQVEVYLTGPITLA